MAEESEIQTAASQTNGNTSPSIPSNSEPIWNYVWDEKLCKTTLKLFEPTVYTPPILPLEETRHPDRYYLCPIEGCGKFFRKTHRFQYRIHIKRHLPESEKAFKCDFPSCTRAFIRYEELDCHKRRHTGEKPYQCEECGKRFTRSCHLTKHLQIHINKAKKKMPPEELSDDESNDSHENAKSQSKPTQKRHKCPVKGCGMAFAMPYGLKRHSWTHTKVKTYECDKCQKTFLRKDHLHKHLKTHSGNHHHNTKITKMSSGEDNSGDGSDASSNFDFSDSSSNSLAPSNSDMPVKKETVIDTGTDLDNRFEEGHEMEEITIGTKNITECSLSSLYTPDLNVNLKENRMGEVASADSAGIDLKSNECVINSVVSVKQEIDADIETDFDDRFEDGELHEMNKITIETKNITESLLPSLYTSGVGLNIKQNKMEVDASVDSLTAAMGLKSNESPMKPEEHVKQEIDIKAEAFESSIETKMEEVYCAESSDVANDIKKIGTSFISDVPVKLELPVKPELDTDAEINEFHYRFEEGPQYKSKDITHESQIIKPSYLNDLNSWEEPTSMSAAIHRIAFPIADKNHVNNFEYNQNPTNRDLPTNMEVSVKKEIETDAEASEYQYRFEAGNQYENSGTTYESQTIAPTYQPELSSLNEITSISSGVPNSKANKVRRNSKSKSTEKLHKCPVKGCDKAFKEPYGLKRHSWTHTKVKSLECDQCKKTFLRKDHLSKHMKTHSSITNIKSSTAAGRSDPRVQTDNRLLTLIKETMRRMSSRGVSGDDGSDATIGFESNDSRSSSLIQTISDMHVNKKLDTQRGLNEHHRFENDHRNEIAKIEFEPEKITDPSLPAFYSTDVHVELNENKMDDIGNVDPSNATNFLESNVNPLSAHFDSMFDVPVKQETVSETGKSVYNHGSKVNDQYKSIHTGHASEMIVPPYLPSSEVPTSVPIKKEIYAETGPESSEYHHGFEEGDQYKSIDSSHQSAITLPPYLPDFNSSSAPTDIPVKQEVDAELEKSQYRHRFVEDNQYKSIDAIHESDLPELYSSNEPTTMSDAIQRSAFPIARKNVKTKSKTAERLFKCPEEGCDMSFGVPYGLKRHSWTHTKEKTFECNQCKKKFLRRDHLSKHLKTHSRNPIIKSPS